MSEIIEVNKDIVHVVRCIDCELRVGILKDGNIIKCVTGRYHDPDWYCADGVRRKENNQSKSQ